MKLSQLVALSVILAFATSTSANASCSCKRPSTVEVAYLDSYSLTKVNVGSLSLTQKLENFLYRQDKFKLNVKVEANIKGKYDDKTIETYRKTDIGECGSKIEGQTIFLVQSNSSDANWSNTASVCNVVSDKFAETVKNYINNPIDDFKAVNTKSWVKFQTNDSHDYYADAKNVKKDELGSLIWVLINDRDTKAVVKSKKLRIHIACHRKLYSVEHEIHFTAKDANGKPIYTSRNGSSEQFMWHEFSKEYDKLMAFTC